MNLLLKILLLWVGIYASVIHTKNRVGEYSEIKISISYTSIEYSSSAIGTSAGANFQLRSSDLSTHSYSS